MNIKELHLYTQNLSKQIEFYSTKIGLDIIKQNQSTAKLQIGKSILTLTEQDDFHPYHFAINIPSEMANEALSFLKKKQVRIFRHNNQEIQIFDDWNAKAVYFYDADNNIVEFIARKNLSLESQDHFDTKSLIQISEIGVAVNDIEVVYNAIQETTSLPIYDGSFERFCAIGEETGLFICINKQIKDWFPTGEKAYSAPFVIKLKYKEKSHVLQFKDGKITASRN